MIRMNPAHDTTNPAGQANVIHQDKPLGVMIDDFKDTLSTKVTWAFTKTYTKEDWDALEISEDYDFLLRGYYEIKQDYNLAVGIDDFSLSYTLDK